MIYMSSTAIFFIISTLIPSVKAISPICDTSYISEIPTDVFSGASTNVYNQFCIEVNKCNGHQPVSWTVNTVGDVLANTLPRRSHASSNNTVLGPLSTSFSGFTIDLAYNPTKKGVPCISHLTCTDIFSAIASNCGHSGPGGNLMAYQGSFGSGCGLYTYYISPPTHTIGERLCYPLNFFGTRHMKVQDWVLVRLIREKVCTPDRSRVEATSNSTWLLNKILRINSVPYVFSIYWLDGCYQRAMDVDFNFPVEGRTDVNCTRLLWDDYTQCSQNDGIGGNITVGCVVYEYKTLDQRVDGNRRGLGNIGKSVNDQAWAD